MTEPSRSAMEKPRLEEIKFAALDELEHAETKEMRAEVVARLIYDVFQDYYRRSRQVPRLAKTAFEKRDWNASLQLSQDRISIYSTCIETLAPLLKMFCPEVEEDDDFWPEVEREYLTLIDGQYQADLAFSFVHSTRRMVFHNQWRPVAYSHSQTESLKGEPPAPLCRTFAGGKSVSAEITRDILGIPGFTELYRNLDDDAARVARRINDALKLRAGSPPLIDSIEIIDGGFYRNRGAYLVGRLLLSGAGPMPVAIALLNEGDGIYVDAVLLESDELQFIFSSTLANFHVTNEQYHELARFLRGVMPKRPLGLHYSTIGFNHVGKVAVMKELESGLSRSKEVLTTAPGFPGSVAIAFTAPSVDFVLKVIRDTPTQNYKWDTFDGVDSVLGKYKRVHELNRTGSMLDNVFFHNVMLPRAWFSNDVLDDLLANAAGTVALLDDGVVFKNLIVQLKITPLPIFLETALHGDAETAVANLGYCIKNNAAANIFNKDLDGRNYGVSKILKVYLFDYDALEPLTDVKIHTNINRIEGEEDIPDWFFEDGLIFLPEELESGLRIDDRGLRRLFRNLHGDLLTTSYWEQMQKAHREGRVPRISVYPEERRLVRA